MGPAYLKLGQFLATRPDVVGVAMARDLESLQDRLPPFSQAEAEAAIATVAGTAADRTCSRASARRSRPPRSRRCIAAKSMRDGVRKAVAVKVLRPNVGRALPPRPLRLLLRRAQGRGLFGRGAAAAPDRGHQHHVALGRDGDGPAAGSRGAVGDGGEHARRSRFPRADRRLGPHRAQRADDGVDRRHRAERSRSAWPRRRSTCPISAAR